MDILKYLVFGKEEKEVKNTGKKINKKTEIKKVSKVKEDRVIYSRRINVAGISNYYDVINHIIEKGMERGIYNKFKGYSVKELKETNESIGEIADQETNTIKLEKYEYKGKDAIKVLLEGEHGKFHEIGSIPKKELKELLPYVESKKLKVKGFFVGGVYRKYDKEHKEFVDTEYELGIELSIIVKE